MWFFFFYWRLVNSFPRHFPQLLLEACCEKTDRDNRGTPLALALIPQPQLEIQREEESLQHPWLAAQQACLLLTDEAVCRGRAPPPPAPSQPLMSSASFILISKGVPERHRLTYRGAARWFTFSYEPLPDTGKETAHNSAAPSQELEAGEGCHLLKGSDTSSCAQMLCLLCHRCKSSVVSGSRLPSTALPHQVNIITG